MLKKFVVGMISVSPSLPRQLTEAAYLTNNTIVYYYEVLLPFKRTVFYLAM